MPAAISTVDKYQGSQNDYILLSLVRTKVPVRWLTLSIPEQLSRARNVVYVSYIFRPAGLEL